MFIVDLVGKYKHFQKLNLRFKTNMHIIKKKQKKGFEQNILKIQTFME